MITDQSVMFATWVETSVESPLKSYKIRVLLSLREEMLYGMYIESLNIIVSTPSLVMSEMLGTTVTLNFFLASNLKTNYEAN